MKFLNDIIKIEMNREGYLPSYPPHLISDEEMLDAFLKYPTDKDLDADLSELTDDEVSNLKWEKFQSEINCMFKDYYPLVIDEEDTMYETYLNYYRELIENISWHIEQYKLSLQTTGQAELPDWIYSYMNQSVVSVNSSQRDKHDLLVALTVDNIDDIFTPIAQKACYAVSYEWLKKLPSSQRIHRSPTLFGAPHVVKALRVKSN